MAKLGFLAIALFLVLELTFVAADSLAPAPLFGADSPSQLAPAPYAGSPSLAPSISPSPSYEQDESPAPSPDGASDINHSNINADISEDMTGGDGGMRGGKTAGIVVVVVIAACLVGFGGLVYKKRQDNIRRSQYEYAARREIL